MIGAGLTAHTKALALQLCGFERIEYETELAIEAEITNPEFERYLKIFDRFGIPRRVEAAILSRIYPFEDFLRDGSPFKEYVQGTDSHRRSGMTKRDRSEGEFKLSLGMGKILHQSGGVTEWKAGGAKYARTALWHYTRMIIVTRRSKDIANFPEIVGALEKQFRKDGVSPWLNEELIAAVAELSKCTPEIASLRVHYEFQTSKGDRHVSATVGRFCRMLYFAECFIKHLSLNLPPASLN
ncbi:MAG: hypothetical protein HC895_08205 [Leptolyngbyaceae cyanobacterium SM1_3_5]|nr:hypothetical protein [Leptolyngbyaceae cyanobacterium SM1_3_5]